MSSYRVRLEFHAECRATIDGAAIDLSRLQIPELVQGKVSGDERREGGGLREPDGGREDEADMGEAINLVVMAAQANGRAGHEAEPVSDFDRGIGAEFKIEAVGVV